MGDDAAPSPSPGGPATDDPRAQGRDLNAYVSGQRILRVETEVRAGAGPWGTEIGLDSGDAVGIRVALPHPNITSATGVRATLAWHYLPARRVLRPLAPAMRRYHPGDGSAIQQELSAYLVGQVIDRIEAGGLTEEGAGVSRLLLRTGESALVFPLPTSAGWIVTWAFQSGAPHLITPGVGWLN
jgi:hypothetical protein